MLETKKKNCPVVSFIKYLEKFNEKYIFLFQRPKPKECIIEKIVPGMIIHSVVGLNTLRLMMKKISTSAELSIIYTNHSIRATLITLLDHGGLEARHIIWL